MTGHIEYDKSALVKALADYTATTTRSLDEIITQRILNIAGRAFDNLSPAVVPAQRAKVREYMNTQLSSKVKWVKGLDFDREKSSWSRGRKNNQLQRKHLIIQARRAKQGLTGLYGDAMRQKSGAASAKAQTSVGFLKSLFLPIITYLNGKARFKFPFAKSSTVARWPNSAGTYGIRKSTGTDLLSQGFEVGANLFLNHARPEFKVARAISEAAVAETEEIRMHIAKKMEADARKHGSR